MHFPPVFQYSQSNLQDYVECERRFQLRHVLRQQWPAPLLEPLGDAEHEMRLGQQFHRLVERYYLGLPVEEVEGASPIGEWWKAFLKHHPKVLPGRRPRPEASYSVPIGAHRLAAKFDLIALEPHKQIVIVDWKTSRKRPSRQTLASRTQTLVYLYVAAEALSAEFGEPVPPAAIKLIYWFTAAPDQPEIFEYNEALHRDGKRRLETLIAEIERHSEPIWPLTENLDRCRACNYRSYCERGSQAASVDDLEMDELLALLSSEPTREVEL